MTDSTVGLPAFVPLFSDMVVVRLPRGSRRPGGRRSLEGRLPPRESVPGITV